MAIIGIVAGSYFYLTRENAKPNDNSTNRPEYAIGIDNFVKLNAQGSPEEIIRYVNGLTIDESSELPIKTERLQQKIELTQRLMDLSDNQDHQIFASANHLDARFKLARLYFQNELADPINNEPLQAMAEKLSESTDIHLRKRAGLAFAYLNVTSLAVASKDDRDPLMARTLGSFEDLAKQHPDDHSVPKELVSYVADLYRRDRENDFSIVLLENIKNLYSSSNNPAIQDVIAQFENLLFNLKYKLGETNEHIKNLVNDVISKNSVKARNLIAEFQAKPELSANNYLEILNSIVSIVHVGDAKTARDLIDEANPILTRPTVPESTNTLFADTKKIVDKFDQQIAMQNLTDNQGNEAAFLENDAPSTLVILAKPGSLAATNAQITAFSELTQMLVESGKLGLTIVFLDDGESENEWSLLSNSVEKISGCRLLRSGLPESTSFQKEFPVHWSPSWMLLDSEGRMKRFNPPKEVLGAQLFELLQLAGK